ncbi:LysM peptidoglycan-binding domain-containing protein [Lachnospiraceae bacterium MD1]|uniref:LysM peptidoglycan-binding domain-containing protein n=1 Tax=Variimorphobacter saccharofermentans TaxID=2755051 RepID=A0A839JYV3_9FIRM|nr:glycosyl hydrolase family 18 protein [Variimorphobacter saccharofermentans]MBB2182544.1 LysM peptidoglycan-binding domain-containing protein [Variimorphobacter saccharofermentans]
MTIHVVQPGETLNAIALQYGVTAERIIIENELPNPENLVVGQSIGIRVPDVVHTVVTGDTLFSIAETYDVSPNQILRNNPSVAADEFLTPGEELVITYADDEELDSILVNGYAYPFIDRTVLRKTLPYLTFLSLFTYGFTSTGELIPIDDEELIGIAQEFGVKPVMMLAPMTEAGEFNSQIAHDMFVNTEGQAQLIENIVTTMEAKGYVGLDIDFEFILPEDKQNFLNFITAVKNRLSPLGLLTLVALAPKTSGEMTGLLYEAHDYPTIGAVADYVLLMTYEWGYLYGPPMATSPLNNVRRVLEYGVSVIDPNKIWMGIPNYAYDWPLPFVRNETVAEAITNQEAIVRAAQFGVTIQFDELAQAPFYNYTTPEGVEHVVWFDDVRSMNAKFRLIPELGIRGAGVWQIMNFFPGLWLAADSIFTLEKLQ